MVVWKLFMGGGKNIVYKMICFLTSFFYSFHMPLFVALSGSLWAMKLRKDGLPSFSRLVRNKWNRLIVPFFLTAFFWSIPLKYISGYWQGDILQTLGDIVIGQILMFGYFNSHLWFLQALFLIFIYSYMIEWLNIRRMNTYLFFFILVLLSAVGRYCEGHHLTVLNITQALLFLLWFYVGFYFEKYRLKLNEMFINKLSWMQWVLWLIIHFVGVYFYGHSPNLVSYALYYILALSGMALIYSACIMSMNKLGKRPRRYIEKVSVDSYGLYLYSDPINYVIIYMVSHILTPETIYGDGFVSFLLYFSRFLFTTSFAYLVIYITKKKKIIS